MYIPENSHFNLGGATKIGRKPSPKKKIYSLVIGFVVLVVMLITALLLSKAESEAKLANISVPYDLEQLWGWSDEVLEAGAGSAEWTLRWDVTTTSKSAFKELTANLFKEENGDMTNKVITNGGKSIRGEVSRLGGILSIHIPEEAGGVDHLLVMLEASSGDGSLQKLLASAAIIGEELALVSSYTDTSMKVHGFAKSKDAVKQLERLSLGKVVEDYEDGGTWSVTLNSSKLLSSQSLDNKRSANLQISAHDHTERKMTELTIGIPLITGDFSSTKNEP
ncbi:hypothetical protein [Paenibacillus sp. L3-i20]|uniref:hypothetical protein n=1 Tax=Paenibacillus sp. L3-i20 TaxID=2905833 RepID=UPI001EDD49AA|nr:hypothetical protein [Paenibacillus sp. L3-i20]GKU76077.1 hypothetical protein L3i20_v204740 [Paenibacillus sp. L3-i20]